MALSGACHIPVRLPRRRPRGRDHGAYDRAIDVQISRLRKLIETDPARPRYLQTVWGVGYVFVPDAGAP